MTWKKEGCTGAIIHSTQQESKAIDICFDIECGIDGIIKIVIKPPEFRLDMTWLIDLVHDPSDSTRLLLKGQTADGDNITSSYIYLTQASPQGRQCGESSVLALELECSELQVSVSDYERGLNGGKSGCLRYDLKGFRCFPAVFVKAEVGEIGAGGIATIDNYDEITGAISIETSKPERVSDWVKRSDEQLNLILDVLAKAVYAA
jgi:hypothetical protein